MPAKKNRYIIKKITRYRNPETGRFQKRKSKNALIESYETQYTEKGKKLRSTRSYKQGKIVIVQVEEDGLISRALNRAGWLAIQNYKDARQIIVTVKGRDYRDKEKRIKGIIDLDKGEQNIGNVVSGRIIAMIHDKGYRPQYKLDIVNWSATKTSKTASRNKKQLKNMTITVEVKK